MEAAERRGGNQPPNGEARAAGRGSGNEVGGRNSLRLMEPVGFLVLVAAGVGIGVYATAVGAGGGFLFTPLLLWQHPEAEPAEVALASVCIVLASSGLSAVRLFRAGRVDLRAVGLVAGATTPAALFGAFGTSVLPREIFALGLAVLIGLLAGYLIWRPSGDAGALGQRGWRRMIRDAQGDRYLYWIPVPRTLAAAGLTSAFTALAGIGGGLFFSLITVRVMRMPVWLAIPASHTIVAGISLVVIVFHTAAGHWGSPLNDAPPLLIGALIANPIGLRFAAVVNEHGLSRLLAAAMIAVAVFTAANTL